VFARIDKTHTLVDFGSMWVSPTARGLGLGSALLEAVKTWARQHDAGILECWVSEGNERAIRLYRNHGLIETNETQLLRGHSSVTVRKMKALLTNHR
jgi:GNAT superfamily N-acetyltransferase